LPFIRIPTRNLYPKLGSLGLSKIVQRIEYTPAFFALTIDGHSITEMQDILFKEESTIKNQRRSILQKLNIYSIREAIDFCEKIPIIPPKTSQIIIKKYFKNSLELHKNPRESEWTVGQHRCTAYRQTGDFRGITFFEVKTLFCWALPSISQSCDIKNPLCSSLFILEIL